jgi:meromycolic acid enoyl-[acyl-carrier protein] reductase
VPPSIPIVVIVVLVALGVEKYANKMALLSEHRILITGVLTDDSLAFGIARRALEEGATIALSGAGRGTSITRRTARKLGEVGDVIELDVTEPAQIDAAVDEVARRFGRLDGLVHAIGFAPETCLGHGMFAAPFSDVATAMHISSYSLAALVGAFRPLLQKSQAEGGASVIALDFDGSRAYPMYDWMGVMKASLEALGRYLAREIGPDRIRVNMLAAGPIRTVAAKSIPGFSLFEDTWAERAPLGWDVHDASAVADAAVALLSPLLRGTTASVIHVDGGAHAMG